MRLLSFPLLASERELTGIGSERAQESDRVIVGPPAPSFLWRSKFLVTKSSIKKLLLSPEIRPSAMMSLSAAHVAIIKTTDHVFETGSRISGRAV